MKINDILRASDVKRFHIVRTLHDQSLAEHTFNMTMIARRLCKTAGLDDVNVMKACLAHDLDEVIIGDIPTPTKDRVRKEGVDINDLYHEVTGRNLSDIEVTIIKAADLIETLWFLGQNFSGSHSYQVLSEMRIEFQSWANNFKGPIGQMIAQVYSEVTDEAHEI